MWRRCRSRFNGSAWRTSTPMSTSELGGRRRTLEAPGRSRDGVPSTVFPDPLPVGPSRRNSAAVEGHVPGEVASPSKPPGGATFRIPMRSSAYLPSQRNTAGLIGAPPGKAAALAVAARQVESLTDRVAGRIESSLSKAAGQGDGCGQGPEDRGRSSRRSSAGRISSPNPTESDGCVGVCSRVRVAPRRCGDRSRREQRCPRFDGRRRGCGGASTPTAPARPSPGRRRLEDSPACSQPPQDLRRSPRRAWPAANPSSLGSACILGAPLNHSPAGLLLPGGIRGRRR
jgi:hypothetical protein